MDSLLFRAALMELVKERLAALQYEYNLYEGLSLNSYSGVRRERIKFLRKTYEFNKSIEKRIEQ